MAAKNDRGAAAILIVNNRKEIAETSLEIQGLDSNERKVKILDQNRLLVPAEDILTNGKLTLPPLSVVLITAGVK